MRVLLLLAVVGCAGPRSNLDRFPLGNQVVREWPFECPAMGPTDKMGQTIPNKRLIRGWYPDFTPVGETPCGPRNVASAVPLDWRELYEADALVDQWNTGDVTFQWCVDDDPAEEPRPDRLLLRLDRSRPAYAVETGWGSAPLREVKECPWRHVTRLPVRAEVSTLDGGVEASADLWLLVTARSPERWTLTNSEVTPVTLSPEVSRNLAVDDGRAVVSFSTSRDLGRRTVHLNLLPADWPDSQDHRRLYGTWTWTRDTSDELYCSCEDGQTRNQTNTCVNERYEKRACN